MRVIAKKMKRSDKVIVSYFSHGVARYYEWLIFLFAVFLDFLRNPKLAILSWTIYSDQIDIQLYSLIRWILTAISVLAKLWMNELGTQNDKHS